jgi:hypothetical protein
LGVPSVSCGAFRRIRKVLVAELEMQHEEPKVNIASTAPARGMEVPQSWRCPGHRRRIYSTVELPLRSSINEELAVQ